MRSTGGPVVINTAGEVFVNGVKAPLRVDGGVISFVDKDRRRCAQRGGRIVSTSVHTFMDAIKKAGKEK